mmetsp:Transcript_15096/g.24793  ORF Transcript_15096/g.24793 Transcript_15096/m.24793 type:complete len:84 (-) Transcript_15096:334-585(-)
MLPTLFLFLVPIYKNAFVTRGLQETPLLISHWLVSGYKSQSQAAQLLPAPAVFMCLQVVLSLEPPHHVDTTQVDLFSEPDGLE